MPGRLSEAIDDLMRPTRAARRASRRSDLRAPTPTPDFIVIGCQRGGSTWLNAALGAHPDLFTPLSEMLLFEEPYYAIHGAILSELAAEARGRRWGFKRPELLTRPEAAERVARHAPDAALLAILREPIARTVSSYNLAVRCRAVPPRGLNEGLRALMRGDYAESSPWAQEILDTSRYATGLRRYLEHYERDRLFVRLDDDLRADSDALLRSAYEFVGVDPGFIPDDAFQPANESVHSRARMRLHRASSTLVFRRDHRSPYLGIRLAPTRVAAVRAINVLDRLVVKPFTKDRPEELEPDVRDRLAELFADEVDDLERILGRSLDGWRKASAGS